MPARFSALTITHAQRHTHTALKQGWLLATQDHLIAPLGLLKGGIITHQPPGHLFLHCQLLAFAHFLQAGQRWDHGSSIFYVLTSKTGEYDGGSRTGKICRADATGEGFQRGGIVLQPYQRIPMV